MLKLILQNGFEIEVKDGSTIFNIMINPNQYSDMWEYLTDPNLKLVKLITENGDMIDQLSDLTVDYEESNREKDIVNCHFYLREKTKEEIELDTLRNQVEILTSQLSVHDGAIADMGEAISDLANEGGLV